MGTRALLLLLVPVALGVACLGPYQILGQELDPTVNLGDQPTWIQATPEQTTLIVFARPDGGISAPFTITTINRDQDCVILAGTYSATTNQIILTAGLQYSLNYEYNLPVTSRTGAQRVNVDAGGTYTVSLDAGVLTLTGTPALGSFISFPQAIAGLWANNQSEAECVFRVFQLTVISSETRILGFNGPAIIQYTSPANFQGTLDGLLNISVDSLFNPDVALNYQNYSDFSGFVLSGTQYTVTDLSGNGYLYKSIYFQMTEPSTDGGAPQPGISGQVSYGNSDGSPPSLIIQGGTPSGGGYELTLDGGPSYFVSYTVPETMDVTACVSTPQQ